jgi:hypothetical protein
MKGPSALSQIFLSWLTSRFDSCEKRLAFYALKKTKQTLTYILTDVSPLTFSPVDLGNLAFLWMLQENNRALELQYSLPISVPELKSITVTLQPDVIRRLTEA